MSILIIAEHNNAALHASTFNLASAASQLGGFDILVAGHQCQSVADAAANVAGAQKVLLADSEAFAHQLPEDVAPLIVSLAGNYSHVLVAATTTGKNLLPRAAALQMYRPSLMCKRLSTAQPLSALSMQATSLQLSNQSRKNTYLPCALPPLMLLVRMTRKHRSRQ